MNLKQKLNNDEDYTKILAIKAKNHPFSRGIFAVLANKKMSVTDIEAELRKDANLVGDYCIQQSTVSNRLSLLRQHGFVNVESQGKFRIYSLAAETPTPSVRNERRPRISESAFMRETAKLVGVLG